METGKGARICFKYFGLQMKSIDHLLSGISIGMLQICHAQTWIKGYIY